MAYILVPVIVVLIVMVVVSLVRGIAAFLASTREEIERDPSRGPTPMQLKQNRMMFARIKFQAAAIVAITLLAALTRH